MASATQSIGVRQKTIFKARYNLAPGCHAYQGTMAFLNAGTGQVNDNSAAFATPQNIRLGTFAEEVDNSAATTATALVNVELDREISAKWFANDGTNPVTAATGLLQMCFALDNQTVSANGVDRPVAGRVWAVDATLGVLVETTFAALEDTDFQAMHQARAVITSIAAYVAAAGLITASAVGAIGAQDGVTLVAGDVVLLTTDKAASSKDAGPYVVANVGGAAAKFVLQRPSWYATGSVQQSGQKLTLGGEGTVYGGSEWKSVIAASNFVVDTTDGSWYPHIQQVTTVAMIAGVSAANSTLYVGPKAAVSAIPVVPGGAQGTLRVSTQTAGIPGTSSLVITSSSNTDTSTVKIVVENW